jgi:hypothetical protein
MFGRKEGRNRRQHGNEVDLPPITKMYCFGDPFSLVKSHWVGW